jgi:hypothetical protein
VKKRVEPLEASFNFAIRAAFGHEWPETNAKHLKI